LRDEVKAFLSVAFFSYLLMVDVLIGFFGEAGFL